MTKLENRTFHEIMIGDQASLKRTLSEQDVELFAASSGEVNPAHLDEKHAQSSSFRSIIEHGIWGDSLISALLGSQFTEADAIYESQDLKFLKPVKLGDEITAVVSVRDKDKKNRITIDCIYKNQRGEAVIAGAAVIIAPSESVKRPIDERSQLFLHEQGRRLCELVDRSKSGAPIRTGVVHPVDRLSIEGVAGAMEHGLITPILIGPALKISAAADEVGIDLKNIEVIDTPHSHAAAAKAVALVRENKLDALMKGVLHTDEIMSEIVSSERGIRTERRISHVYVMDTPAYDKLLFITDAAINICPDLNDKRDIVQNAIDLATALGTERPKAAVLSAVETVYPKLQSTLDAAALCKMADRGQITGGVIDGPLAFDNAISPAAAEAKGLKSPVAGYADILVVPDLEAGNMLAKELDYLAGAVAAGIVLGARVPIILTSRAEGKLPRIAASAIAKLYSLHQRGA